MKKTNTLDPAERYPKIKCEYSDPTYFRMAVTGMIGFAFYTLVRRCKLTPD